MINEILSGITAVFAPGPIVGIAAGVVIGIAFGAIPGISGIMGIAILLPLTFYVDPLIGIPMLLGLYKAGIFGGSISAVLLNTPGAPPAICTSMEGYPLTQQGKAGKALHTALVGSVFGDTFSNLLLIFIAAPLSLFTLKIGSVEQFSLIVLAMTVVGSISGKSLLKGILSCCFGILLSCIGISESTGATRFTLGVEDLAGGISLIPMVIGLLCLPEVISQVCIASKDYVAMHVRRSGKSDDERMTWAEFTYCLPIMLRSSLIGSFLGAMPGIGATPAAFMSYSEAKRTSKHPERFGKGAVDGIAAPEAGNNATTGSAMIPMLTLGIPGDDVTAVLMGAFVIQGITPGPLIFQEHGALVYGIFGGLLICDVLLYFIAKLGFPLWIKMSQLPKYVIFPAVTVFSFVGAYTINQSMFDIMTLIVFGIIGYYVRRWHYSAGAFIIGFVLGPIGERSFDQSMVLSDGSFMIFLTHPISAGLLVVALLSAVSIGFTRRRTRLQNQEA